MGRTSDAKERLIEAGIPLFWRHGFAAVSVDDLCAAAGVKKGSFYHFFEGKEELALACLETHWARRRPSLDEAFSPSRPPLERFTSYFGTICERQTQMLRDTGRVLGCFFFSLGVSSAENPRIAARVQQIVSIYERYYESAMRDAHAQGLIDAPDPADKAHALFAYMQGIMADARVHNNTATLQRLPRLALDFMGVRSPKLAS